MAGFGRQVHRGDRRSRHRCDRCFRSGHETTLMSEMAMGADAPPCSRSTVLLASCQLKDYCYDLSGTPRR